MIIINGVMLASNENKLNREAQQNKKLCQLPIKSKNLKIGKSDKNYIKKEGTYKRTLTHHKRK